MDVTAQSGSDAESDAESAPESSLEAPFGQEIGVLNIPAGGKLNPRFVCFWRSNCRHWMRNAWFWQTIQFMIFAVPLCFGLFRAFCNVFCIHELPKSAPFFAVFLQYAGFSTFVRAFFSIAKDSHLDWTVSFKTLAVF